MQGRSSLFVGAVDRSKYTNAHLISTFWRDSPSSYYWDVWNGKLVSIDERGNQTGIKPGYGCECHNYEQTKIAIIYDTKKRTLNFWKDGIDQGVAFSNVPKGLYPAVDLWFEEGYIQVTGNT